MQWPVLLVLGLATLATVVVFAIPGLAIALPFIALYRCCTRCRDEEPVEGCEFPDVLCTAALWPLAIVCCPLGALCSPCLCALNFED
jgi:hypothetical protein